MHRDWATQKKGLGLAAAVAGALVGTWLGFYATAGFMALLTAILGAVAGSNLVVILLDMLQGGPAGDQVATDVVADTRSTDVRPEIPTGVGMR